MNKTVWSAKVHTSGTKIQLLKNGSMIKVIKANDDTFVPENAQDFAKNLVASLNSKVAKQMVNPDGKVTVETKAEEQADALKAVEQDAKGISPKQAASLIEENKSLKRKVAKMEKDAATERKARRGLAIAKQLVEQKKIANSEQAIKDQVMKIVAMSNEEIGMLEKKVAGIPLYNSADEASLASLRYARMARLHRQAAEDAQLAGDETLADNEDMKAAHYDNLSKEASSFTAATNDAIEQVKDEAKGVDAQGKKASEELDEDEAAFEANEFDDDDDDSLIDSEDFEVQAAAAIYKKIASDHRAKAEELRAAGKTAEADEEDEIADESEQLATCVASEEIEEEDDTEIVKQAASIYRKIASEHRAKADELEAAGKTAEADIEDEIADEAEQLAATVEGGKVADALTETEEKVADHDVADAEEVSGTEAPKVAEAAETPVAPVETPVASVEAPVETPVEEVKEAAKEEEAKINSTEEITSDNDKDAGKEEDDPLAALLIETGEKEAGEEEEINLDDVPNDDLITAALAGDSDDEEDEKEKPEEVIAGVDEVEEEDKEASSEETTKVANEGYSHKVASDRVEQNPAASDPQVKEIEDMLWGK